MKHRINGCPINLGSLADDQLDRLIQASSQRRDRVAQERALLVAERVRRAPAHEPAVTELKVAS
ncbi:MAG: hypothetical protein ACOYBY_13955 [Dermatophilaceae bacterium]